MAINQKSEGKKLYKFRGKKHRMKDGKVINRGDEVYMTPYDIRSFRDLFEDLEPEQEEDILAPLKPPRFKLEMAGEKRLEGYYILNLNTNKIINDQPLNKLDAKKAIKGIIPEDVDVKDVIEE